jgi:hypothetical protein
MLEAARSDSEPTYVESVSNASVSYRDFTESKNRVCRSLSRSPSVLRLDPSSLLDDSYWEIVDLLHFSEVRVV